MKSIAVIIHARTKSTRCPNKHLRDLGDGTTLLDIAINKVSKLVNVEEKYLAVHEEELKERANGKIDILHREYDSIAPGNPTHDIMYRHLKNVKADYIVNWNPCQPFIDVEKAQAIINDFKVSNIKSGITVTQKRNWFWNENGDPVNFKEGDRLSTTAGPWVYEATHSLVMYKKQYMLENWELFPNLENDPMPFIISWPEEEMVDVDTELDFKLVKAMYEGV